MARAVGGDDAIRRRQELVGHASPLAVGAGYLDSLRAGPGLISSDNRFLPDGTGKRVDEHGPAYLAGASILHLEAAFSYFGRALGALISGDDAAAVHLAYYSELRATLSLLAAQGLLIRGRRVFALSEDGTVESEKFIDGTHPLAWTVLELWSSREGAAEVFAGEIRPFKVPLSDWMTAAVPGTGGGTAQGISGRWLKAWCADVQRIRDDLEERNRMSYRPEVVNAPDPKTVVQFLRDVWSILEPSPGTPFANLDPHLLKLVLSGRTDDTGVETARSGIEKSLREGIPQHGPIAGWEGFLFGGSSQPEPLPVTLASNADRCDGMAVSSRAMMLTRVAAGSLRRQLRAAGVPAADLEPWACRVAQGRGLALEQVDDAADLWADVEDAMMELSTEYSVAALRSAMWCLQGSERATLWAVAA